MKTLACVLFAASLFASGCRTADCKKGTVFLDVKLPVDTVEATQGVVLVSIDGGASKSSVVTLPTGKREGGIEIDFASGYPTVGTPVVVTVSVTIGDVVYTATKTVNVGSGCSSVTLELVGAGGADLAVPSLDLGSTDAGVDLSVSTPDLSIEPPDFAGVDLKDCVSETPTIACGTHVCGNVVDNCDKTVSCGTCELYSVSPAYAETAKTVDLEGTFDANAVVNFPGGVTATPVVMGAHRLRVAVPLGAARGTLSVTSNGATTNALGFAHTTYQSTLARFTREYPQTSVARVAPQLAVARALAGAAVLGGAAYVVGGVNTSGALSTVDRATVNADGTLGAFKTLASPVLNTARSGHRVVTIGSTLHVVGGSGGGTVPLSDEYATLGADGTLGSFSVGPATKLSRAGAAVVVAGKWLYVIGGVGDVTLRQIERAPIMPGGTLGAFDYYTLAGGSAPLSIPADFVSGQAYVVGNTLNLVGGCGSQTGYVATLDTDGNITTGFTSVANVTPASACGAAFVRIDGSAYLVGGADSDLVNGDGTGKTAHDNVFVQPADGNTAGSFAAAGVSGVPDERMDAVGFSTSNAYFVCGGIDSMGNRLTSCTVAQANTSSGIGTFATAALGTTSNNGVVFAAGPYVYLVGTSNGDILRATVTNDVLGPFTDTKVALAAPVISPSVLVAGDDVYIMGGSVIGSASTDIEDATVDASGMLSTPASNPGSTLGVPRMNAVAAYVGPNVYVDGGKMATGGTALMTRDSAAASVGTLGTFKVGGYGGASNSTDSAGLVVDYTWYILSNTGALSSCPGDATGLGNCASYGSVTYTPLADRASVLVGRRWFVLGGATLDQTPVVSSAIESFLIDNGAPDPGTATAVLAQPVTGAEAITIGNSLYVLDANNSQTAALK